MIYLDYNATTPLSEGVKKRIVDNLELFYNPSSLYSESKVVMKMIKEARNSMAELLRTTSENVFFTSCSTESNNSVINHCIRSAETQNPHLIISSVEHPAILKAAEFYNRSNQAKVTIVPVDSIGRISINEILSAVTPDTVLVSIMLVNNEIGNIYPVSEISRKVHAIRNDIVVHTDATQAVGKMIVDVHELDVDFLTFSGHKFHAPKGIGGLYIREPNSFIPFLFGGHQEKLIRAGTENTLFIIAMGQAACEALEDEKERTTFERISALSNYVQNFICKKIPNCTILGDPDNRICNTLCILVDGVSGIEICAAMNAINEYRFCLSSGAACNSDTLEPSHVMHALGVRAIPIRMSIGKFTTKEEIELFCKYLQTVIIKLRKMKGMY